MAGESLAHSAPTAGAEPQLYKDHVGGTPESDGVVRGAQRRAEAMLRYLRDADVARALVAAVADAATFHDLGKLDPENQAALRQGRGAKLPWDHIDAGVAHLRACKASSAAWVVRGHHALDCLPYRPISPARRSAAAGATQRRLRSGRSPETDRADGSLFALDTGPARSRHWN